MATIAVPPLLRRCAEPQKRQSSLIDMRRVATIILGGGQGSRLFPLTTSRCKPAMCYGGRYHLIDIPISNALNSGCQKIYVLTQYLARSLHQHICATYRMDPLSSGCIEILTAEEKPQNRAWFQGTADAVRQNLDYFVEIPADYFLVLSGDQLYKMDFRNMVKFGQESDADVIIASLPVEETEAKRMGILKLNQENFITNFVEKPQLRGDLNRMKLSKTEKQAYGISLDSNRDYLGSMGIYLFKRQALIDLLQTDLREDFGKHLIPSKVNSGNIAAYIHQGYWEDIGTIESFYHANMALTKPNPPFDCYDEDWRIHTSHHSIPGAKIYNTLVNSSILCEGSIIEADEINHSIIGPRTIIGKGSIIHNSYFMGNDFFALHVETSRLPEKFQIGEYCLIRKAIVDKFVHIGNRVQLINKENISHYDSDNLYIRDGIIIVPRGASIPDGFVI